MSTLGSQACFAQRMYRAMSHSYVMIRLAFHEEHDDEAIFDDALWLLLLVFGRDGGKAPGNTTSIRISNHARAMDPLRAT